MTTQHIALLIVSLTSLALVGGVLYLIFRRPEVPDSYIGKLFGFERRYWLWEIEGTEPSLHWVKNIWRHRKPIEHYVGRPIVLYSRVGVLGYRFGNDALTAEVCILAPNEEAARAFFENEVTQPPFSR